MIKVPDEPVYSLLDVWNSVSSHNDYYQFSDTTISIVNKDFRSCVLWAESGYYNPTYFSAAYAPKGSLKQFRDYGLEGDTNIKVLYSSGAGPTYITFYGELVYSNLNIIEVGFVYDSDSDKPVISSSPYKSWTTPYWLWTGTYTLWLDGLVGGVTYYVRAYAKAATGQVIYSPNVQQITVAYYLPVIEKFSIINQSGLIYKMSAEVTSGGNTPVSNKGFLLSLSPNPVIGGTGVTNYTKGSGTGLMQQDVTLAYGNTYYGKAYATNGGGTTYTDDLIINMSSWATTTVSQTPIIDEHIYMKVTESLIFSERFPGWEGELISFGSYQVLELGVVYNSGQTPTIDNSSMTVKSPATTVGKFRVYYSNLGGQSHPIGRYKGYVKYTNGSTIYYKYTETHYIV